MGKPYVNGHLCAIVSMYIICRYSQGKDKGSFHHQANFSIDVTNAEKSDCLLPRYVCDAAYRLGGNSIP
jgi:hypothetical protein